MKGRIGKSVVNVLSSLIGQFFAIFIGFISRIIFVNQLGDTYLGINGLCTSIVGLLSLTELGVGEAINYKLYKPLAENNVEQLKSLMKLYKTVYFIIGSTIIIIGLSLLPFLNFFLKTSDINSVNNFYVIFILFIINSASSYFFSYKRALIISDQKRFVVNIYHYTSYFIMNLVQIIILIQTNNYIFYLIVMILFTIGLNIFISNKANTLYPFLKDKIVNKLSTSDISEIKKNTLALMCHKVGSQVVNSTDNILASKLIGIVVVGIYSNYLLIITALNTIISQLFSAITASVGNLGATEDEKKSESVFYRLFFGNFVFVLVVCASFYSSIDFLIVKMFGPQRVLEHNVLLCMLINLFLYNIRRTVWTFRDGLGLFWYDRYKAIAEAVVNLVASVILGIKFGLFGILLGTIVSTVLTSLWIEPYVLFKYAFKKTTTTYFFKLFGYSILGAIVCIISKYLVSFIQIEGYFGFCLGCCISCFVVFAFIFVLFRHSDEFLSYCQIFKNIIVNYSFNRHK